jgi:hypothetical protein
VVRFGVLQIGPVSCGLEFGVGHCHGQSLAVECRIVREL